MMVTQCNGGVSDPKHFKLLQTVARVLESFKRPTGTSLNSLPATTAVHSDPGGEVEEIDGSRPLSVPYRMSPGKARLLSHDEEQTRKRSKLEENLLATPRLVLIEPNSLKECRRRTYSHWSEKYAEFTELLIDAGFLGCNVGDRTICIYCNIICQEWDVRNDDPQEFHRLVSPTCAYLPLMSKSVDVRQETVPDEDMTGTQVCHVTFRDATIRKRSFETKNDVPLAKLGELVDGGFFFSADTHQVRCFNCDGHFLDWKTADSVRVAHVKISPHCAVAKAHCGADLYRSIIRNMQLQTPREKPSVRRPNLENLIDESQLSRLVAARLDLPVSQELLNRNYRLAVIKRVWEDQLRIKHDDFVEDTDIYVACQILQKQIDIINGNKDNIIIPKVKMDQILRQNAAAQESTGDEVMAAEPAPAPNPVAKEEKVVMPTKAEKEEVLAPIPVNNPCLVCKKAEKQLACIPCGHLATCVTCGQNIRTCPTCRKDIDAYVRVYM